MSSSRSNDRRDRFWSRLPSRYLRERHAESDQVLIAVDEELLRTHEDENRKLLEEVVGFEDAAQHPTKAIEDPAAALVAVS